ncbi:hypothetical protein FHG87_012821 [Trinorchestia longiramus]|nr:hypothetical protein FHG87_012821 [Trinorchestia longiramus]
MKLSRVPTRHCGSSLNLPFLYQVIFSQSSELERQSSMASSTEEVSAGGAGGGEDRTPADDITSSENQFAVFKDFDFLEYELESQGEESVDNFNLWGVRRRSPTNSSAPLVEPPHPQPPSQPPQDPPSPASPPSPPPEPDWWGDEEGSVSPVDDSSLPTHTDSSLPTHTDSHAGLGKAIPAGGLNQEESAPEGVEVRGPPSPSHHPPDSLQLNTSAVVAMRSPSRGSLSDESSEGDLGELTPCNAPGSLVFPTRPPEHPLHSCWRAHLSALTQLGSSGLSAPAYSCALFSALFAECVNKTYSAVREAAPLLGQLGSATSTLVSNLEAVGCVSPLPYVYLDSALLERGGVASKVRSSFIALHEHTDTFLDKLDTALMVVDALRGSVMKVSVTSDSGDSTNSRGCSDEQQVEVCRALYRLHFQVSLLYDTYAKMLLLLLHASRHTPATDHSVELSALRAKLVAAAEQLDATPPCSPAPHPLHRHLPEGEECESDSVGGETDACSLDEDVGGESTSSLISSYHPPPPPTGHPTTLPTPTHSSGTSTYAPASLPTPTLSTSSTFPLITTPTLSMASTLPTMPSLPQANHKVLQLVANQKWREVVLYSDENSSVWQQPGMPHHNITTVLNIYCTYLAEKQPDRMGLKIPTQEWTTLLVHIPLNHLSEKQSDEYHLYCTHLSEKQSDEYHLYCTHLSEKQSDEYHLYCTHLSEKQSDEYHLYCTHLSEKQSDEYHLYCNHPSEKQSDDYHLYCTHLSEKQSDEYHLYCTHLSEKQSDDYHLYCTHLSEKQSDDYHLYCTHLSEKQSDDYHLYCTHLSEKQSDDYHLYCTHLSEKQSDEYHLTKRRPVPITGETSSFSSLGFSIYCCSTVPGKFFSFFCTPVGCASLGRKRACDQQELIWAGMIAVCCTEQYLSETSQQLADANLAALAALRLLETEQQQLQQQQGQSGFLPTSLTAQQHPTLYSTAAGSMSPMSSNATQAGALFSSTHHSLNSSQHSTLQSVLQQSSLSSSQAGAATLTRRSHSPHSSISGDEPCLPSSNPPHLSSPVITQPQSPELVSLSQSYSSRISHSSPTTSPLRSVGLPAFVRQKSGNSGVPLASPPHPLAIPLASPSQLPYSPSLSLASPTLVGALPRQLSSLDELHSSADFSTSSLPPPAGDSPVSCEPQLTVSQPSTPRRSTQC